MSGSDLVDGLHSEVVLAVGVEVFDGVGQDVLSRHDRHVGLLGGFAALQGVTDNRGATVILWGFPADLAGVLGDVTGGDVFTLTRESCGKAKMCQKIIISLNEIPPLTIIVGKSLGKKLLLEWFTKGHHYWTAQV